MKKIILILILFITACRKDPALNSLKTNPPTAKDTLLPKESIFPLDNFIIKVGGQGNDGAPSPYTRYFSWVRQYNVGGDTLINSKTFKEIVCNSYQNEYFFATNSYSQDTTFQTWCSAFIRVVEKEKKIYAFIKDVNSEVLLFDYNLTVGSKVDTWVTRFETVTVTSIDSVKIGTRYRKKYMLQYANSPSKDYILESVGSSAGLFERVRDPNNLFSYCRNGNIYSAFPYRGDFCKIIK